MANNDSATPITTGTIVGSLKEKGIYYFKLGREHFLYDEDEHRLCGLTGAEIDSNFHFLSGFDIKNVEFGESGSTVVITRVNPDFSAITLNLTETRPTYRFDTEDGCLYVKYPEKEEEVAACGFFVDVNDEGKYNVKVYTDGTLDGLGSQYKPMSLSRLERTGTFAPVEKLIDGPITDEYIGRRVLTKEPVDDYGHLYAYPEVEAIQAALEADNSPWRVATKADWDELLNAMEETAKDHDETSTGYKGEEAGCLLKSTKYWEHDANTNVNNKEHEYTGFNILPVGYAAAGRGTTMSAEDFDIEQFGKNAGFWTRNEEENEEAWVKVFGAGFDSVRQYKEESNDLGTLYSVRLVKECEPGCPEEYETILGDSYPVGPIIGCFDDYCKIWTLSNFYGDSGDYSGVTLDGDREEYAYFINECDGRKKRMMEGESIVILDNEQNPKRHEFRIINGELVDTYDEVKNEIAELSGNVENKINEVQTELSESIANLSDETKGLINELSAGTTNEFDLIQGRFNNVYNNVIPAVSAATTEAITNLSNNTVQSFTLHSALIEQLEEKVDNFSVGTEDRFTRNEAEIANISANTVAMVTAAVLATNEAIDDINERIAGENSGRTADIQALDGRVSGLERAVSAHTEDIEELRRDLGDLSDSLEYHVGDIDEDIAETNDRISALANEKVTDLYFDENNKLIKLLKADGALSTGISAEDFLKDSVLTSVEYDEDGDKLIFIWDDTYSTKTEIKLSKLSNVYGISQDSLAFLKLSGTNISAIVDKADGFEKTLATTKFVENIASAMTGVIAELVTANNENREDIDTLNGDKNTAGSVQHALDDKFNTTLLTAGLPVTTVSVDDARNSSLMRVINVGGENKYFVSNSAKDIVAENKSGQPVELNTYVNNLERKVETLEAENTLLKDRVATLEQRVDELAMSGLDETMIKNIIKNYLKGTDKEIKVAESGGTLQVGFADDAVFGWAM